MDESWLSEAMKAFRRAVAAAGGQAPFERKTGMKQQTVSYRLQNGIPLKSAEEVLLVESAFGVSRHDLRLDIFPRDRCFEASCPEHGARAQDPREDAPCAPPAGDVSPPAGGSSSARDRSALEGVRS